VSVIMSKYCTSDECTISCASLASFLVANKPSDEYLYSLIKE